MSAVIAYPHCPLVPELQAIPTKRQLPTCHITHHRHDWVRLFQHPRSTAAMPRAKLLCQEAHGVWIAWIPEYGEAVLDRSQFYC